MHCKSMRKLRATGVSPPHAFLSLSCCYRGLRSSPFWRVKCRREIARESPHRSDPNLLLFQVRFWGSLSSHNRRAKRAPSGLPNSSARSRDFSSQKVKRIGSRIAVQVLLFWSFLIAVKRTTITAYWTWPFKARFAAARRA